MLALAERLGARGARDRPLRAGRRRRRGPAARRRRRRRQGPDLHALGARARDRSRGCASRSASLTKPEVRELAAAAGLPVAGKAREPGPLLPRRRGQARASSRATAAFGDRPGELVDRAGRVARQPPRPPPLHGRPAPGDRRRRAASRSTCSPPTRRRTGSPSGRARSSRAERVAVRDAILHRRGARVDRVRLRYHSRPLACRLRGRRPRATHDAARARARRARLRRRPRPDRLPARRRPGRRPRHDRSALGARTPRRRT